MHLLAPFRASRQVVEFRCDRGPRIFQAPLSHESVLEKVVDTMVQSSISFVWESWRDPVFHGDWPGNDLPADRTVTTLDELTSPLLVADWAEESTDEVGRRLRIVAQRASNAVPQHAASAEESLREFLLNGIGIELVVYQPNDTWEYIYVSRDLCAEGFDLIENRWGLLSCSEHRRCPLGISSATRSGKFPP